MQNVLPQEAERRQALYGEKSLLVPSAAGWGWFFTHGSVPWVLLGALWGWGMRFLSTEVVSWSRLLTHSSSWSHCSIVQIQWKWYMEEGTWGRFVLVIPQVKPLLRQSCLHSLQSFPPALCTIFQNQGYLQASAEAQEDICE